MNDGMRLLWTLSICAVLLTLYACQPSPPPPPTRSPSPLDLLQVGTISGQVRFEGSVPAPTLLQLGGWSACRVQHPDGLPAVADLLVRDGRLQNALVSITHGLGERVFAVPQEPVHSDQRGCVFIPRILTVRVDQPLRFVNSDPIAHNVHGWPQQARPWNLSLGITGASKTIRVRTPESVIPITCDIHGWMRAYVAVFDHPYFALTDAEGRFSLSKVPPGVYVLEAWHERLGVQRTRLELGPREERELVFTFHSGD